ncbi:hypothetical protein BHE74_00049200 [Ensete ventricosum]|nr:hypothetical protein GW17_00030765 [Ensete ventricosum]RWW44995.1 hypothetical protein BHE74_00049200 [Ensete ventricosum]
MVFKVVIIQAVPTAKGQALADEYGIKFFETVSIEVLVVWLQDRTIKINKPDQAAAEGTAASRSACCGS